MISLCSPVNYDNSVCSVHCWGWWPGDLLCMSWAHCTQHEDRHAGPHMTHLTEQKRERWSKPASQAHSFWFLQNTKIWRTESILWWAIALIIIAVSEVHFTSMRRAGLCRDLCEWRNAGGTDGKLQARAQWTCKPRVTKGRLLPWSGSVSHQSQSHHQAVVNAVSEGILNAPRQRLWGELLLNNELRILRVIYVYIGDSRNNRRSPHTTCELGEGELILLTTSCIHNCVYCRNTCFLWRDTQLPWTACIAINAQKTYSGQSTMKSSVYFGLRRAAIGKLLLGPIETCIS